jgi:hypothetical protein
MDAHEKAYEEFQRVNSQNRLFIIVLRWQTRCKARICNSVLSCGHGNVNVPDRISDSNACGDYSGYKAETSCLPVPAGRAKQAASLTVPRNISFLSSSPLHKSLVLLPGSYAINGQFQPPGIFRIPWRLNI